MKKKKEMTYVFSIEYLMPEFADITVETKEDINKAKEIAMKEFMEMYPEAVEPEIISWSPHG